LTHLPTDAIDNTVNNERRNPRDNEEWEERNANCQTTPSSRRDIRNNDVVHDIGSRLTHTVKYKANGVCADILGRSAHNVREKVAGNGEGVGLSSTDDVG
jgi:hypothetical protein